MGLRIVRTVSGVPGTTFNVAVDDTITTIPSAELTRDGAKAVGAIITNRDNDVVYAFNDDPDQSGLGHLLADGDTIELSSYAEVRDIRFINETAASDNTLTVTILF